MSGGDKSKPERVWIPQTVSCVLLVVGLLRGLPYGYYVLLRWVCCAAFAYLALHAHRQKQDTWTWVLGVTAAIYNPIVPLHLGREVWTVVNLATIVIAAFSLSRTPRQGSR